MLILEVLLNYSFLLVAFISISGVLFFRLVCQSVDSFLFSFRYFISIFKFHSSLSAVCFCFMSFFFGEYR